MLAIDTTATVPRILPLATRAPDAVSAVLPVSLDLFFRDHFNRKSLRLNRTSTRFDVGASGLWQRDELGNVLAEMAADNTLTRGSSAITVHGAKGASREKWQLPAEPVSAEAARPLFEERLTAGDSFVLKFEYVSRAHRPYRWLSEGLFNITGIPASIHLYASAAGAKVLNPHTDPYDVLVWQLQGSKSWRACVPRAELAKARAFSSNFSVAGDSLTEAQLCLFGELARDSIEGCTQYTVDDTQALTCEDFTMGAGDVLYMPKGVVHYAVTDADEQAFHLTIGLHRQNMQWLDVLHHVLTADVAMSPAGISRAPPPEPLLELMQVYSETAEGVHLHEFSPETVEAARLVSATECAAHDAELRRLYDVHLSRYEAWLEELARSGPWRLALNLAAKEASPGESPDVDAYAHLFWWTGRRDDARRRLHPDEARFGRALDEVALVVDYHDTKEFRWKRRVKGGTGRDQRSHDEPPVGEPTLCDAMSGWRTECRGSDAHTCEVFVKNSTSCSEWCEARGAWCEAAWDDRGGGCRRIEPTSAKTSCAVKRGDQICRCRRDCADSGPWPCNEAGCPSKMVNCSVLAVACGAGFGDIWDVPPAGIGKYLVSQVCPMSCGKCTCQAPPPPKDTSSSWLYA